MSVPVSAPVPSTQYLVQFFIHEKFTNLAFHGLDSCIPFFVGSESKSDSETESGIGMHPVLVPQKVPVPVHNTV
jgi:hypothetical protein